MNEYHLYSTPWYINNVDSHFWNKIAHDVSFEQGEKCPHSDNFKNFNVHFVPTGKKHLELRIICKKCHLLFLQTSRYIQNNQLEKYGF